jgi:cytochrome c2
VFKRCQTCHDIKAEKNKVGPHLVGIVGRPAGSVEGFKYSEAMKSSGVTWTEENIAIYVIRLPDDAFGRRCTRRCGR